MTANLGSEAGDQMLEPLPRLLLTLASEDRAVHWAEAPLSCRLSFQILEVRKAPSTAKYMLKEPTCVFCKGYFKICPKIVSRCLIK